MSGQIHFRGQSDFSRGWCCSGPRPGFTHELSLKKCQMWSHSNFHCRLNSVKQWVFGQRFTYCGCHVLFKEIVNAGPPHFQPQWRNITWLWRRSCSFKLIQCQLERRDTALSNNSITKSVWCVWTADHVFGKILQMVLDCQRTWYCIPAGQTYTVRLF